VPKLNQEVLTVYAVRSKFGIKPPETLGGFFHLVPGFAKYKSTRKEVVAWTLMVTHYILVCFCRRRCYLIGKGWCVRASPNPVPGIEISWTPPSAGKDGGVF
jgi:hypothetical protein